MLNASPVKYEAVDDHIKPAVAHAVLDRVGHLGLGLESRLDDHGSKQLAFVHSFGKSELGMIVSSNLAGASDI